MHVCVVLEFHSSLIIRSIMSIDTHVKSAGFGLLTCIYDSLHTTGQLCQVYNDCIDTWPLYTLTFSLTIQGSMTMGPILIIDTHV